MTGLFAIWVYSEACGAKLNHYHDTNDLEIDVIIELGTQWAGLEIKLGAHNVIENLITDRRSTRYPAFSRNVYIW